MVKDTWLRVKERLSDKLPAHTISTWFDPISPIALEHNEFVLEVPSQFFMIGLSRTIGRILTLF